MFAIYLRDACEMLGKCGASAAQPQFKVQGLKFKFQSSNFKVQVSSFKLLYGYSCTYPRNDRIELPAMGIYLFHGNINITEDFFHLLVTISPHRSGLC